MNFHLRLTINTSIALFLLKFWFFSTSQNQMRSIYLISFVQDVFLLIATYFLFIFAVKKFKKLQLTGKILFYIFYSVFGITSFVYTFFLFDLLSFPINVFGINIENISFFMEYFMNIKLIIALIIAAGILVGISYIFPKKIGWSKLPATFAILFSLLAVPTVLRPGINPLVYSIQEQIMLSFGSTSYLSKLESPTANPQLKDNFRFLNKSFDTIPKVTSKYKRVVVLVMEGINHKEFFAKSNSFINRYQQNIVSYDNYYTLNLDSYTSLLAMLNNIFIPYQAYVDERKYNFINEQNNLVRFFNANGFSTHFLTSYGEQQKRFVPDIREWTEVVCMKNIDSNTKYASVKSSKIEFACEDLAVFDDLISILKNNAQAFVFQEMVYGHTGTWQEQTGVETIDYYNQYFNKTVEALKSNNLLDSTLIVIVSDHGPRDNAYATENYHIPMLAWANDLKKNVNKNFTSHLDFKDILLELISGDDFLQPQESIYTLGNSGELIYGKITKDNNYIFINNRMSNLKSNMDKETITQFNRSFQDYLNYFESFKTGAFQGE